LICSPVRFKSDVNGFVTGIRFYKGTGNGGTHVGRLWTNSGALLGTTTFTAETAAGCQQASFSTPIAVTAGTVYVASYFDPQGHYAADRPFFALAGVDAAPLHALAAGPDGAERRLRQRRRLPDIELPVDQLLGRRRLHA
jgi:hypothetical protein